MVVPLIYVYNDVGEIEGLETPEIDQTVPEVPEEPEESMLYRNVQYNLAQK